MPTFLSKIAPVAGWLVLAALLSIALPMAALAQPGGGPRTAKVHAAAVEEIWFSERIEALGTLEPKERADLTLNAADTVTGVYFEDGERVREGETLIALTRREQRAQIESVEARLKEARVRMSRLEELVEYEAAAQADLDAARRDVRTAAADIRALQSRLRDRVLVAPFSGVLGFRQVSVGSYIQPGDVVATLIDDSVMRLQFGVPERFITQVERGTLVDVETDSLPGRTFAGKVTSIDNAIDPATRAFRVRATLPNKDRILKSGMFMRVTVRAARRQAPAVPEESIQAIASQSFVYKIAPDGTVKRTEVTVGTREAGRVEILSGVVPGDRVVTEGIIRVRDGSTVEVIENTLRDGPTKEPGPLAQPAATQTGAGAAAGASGR